MVVAPAAPLPWVALEPVHLSTGAGTVRCGRHMSNGPTDPGFDLGTSTTDRREVTCLHCLGNTRWAKAAR
jgi:hypothetical protein